MNTDFYIVSTYLVDRAYGGPEEGGWWYSYGIVQRPDDSEFPPVKTFDNRAEAVAYRDEVQKILDETVNVGRPNIDSVLSQGVYRAQIDVNAFPRDWPAERPYYE